MTDIKFYIQYFAEYQHSINNNLINYDQSQTINLDHQRIFFDKSEKNFAWKGSSPFCNNYRITSITCDGEHINHWEETVDRNIITVPTKGLLSNGSDPELLLLTLDSQDDEGDVCQEAIRYIEVNTSGTVYSKLIIILL